MGLETGTYINSLNEANPAFNDPVSAGDDHIRLIKSTIKNTFPNLTGEVTATHTELNHVDGVTSNVQTQLDDKTDKVSGATAGNVATLDANGNLQDGGSTVNTLARGKKNAIINGAFGLWQRGVSTSSFGYLADRWSCVTGGTGFLQQRTAGPTGSFYSLMASATMTTAQTLRFNQKIEGINAAHFHNREFTVSFKMRSANGEGHPVLYIGYPSSLNNYVGNEYPIGHAFSSLPDTGWHTYTFTSTMVQSASAYTCANGIDFIIDYAPDTNGARQAQIADVQLELGPVATEFEREDISTTLLRCQRYYYAAAPYMYFSRPNDGDPNLWGTVKFAQTMRTAPTVAANSSAPVTVSSVSSKYVTWVRAGAGVLALYDFTADAEL